MQHSVTNANQCNKLNYLSDGSYPYCPACYWFGILCPRFAIWFKNHQFSCDGQLHAGTDLAISNQDPTKISRLKFQSERWFRANNTMVLARLLLPLRLPGFVTSNRIAFDRKVFILFKGTTSMTLKFNYPFCGRLGKRFEGLVLHEVRYFDRFGNFQSRSNQDLKT